MIPPQSPNTAAATDPRPASETQPDRPARSTGRRAAEWATMGLAMLIVAGVALYLLYQAVFVGDPAYVPVELRPRYDQVQLEGPWHILPVEVHNHGQRTIHDFTGQISHPGPDGEPQTRDFTIDYLGERATTKVYFLFDQPPRSLSLELKPLSYRLD